jgi:hypothetical protein
MGVGSAGARSGAAKGLLKMTTNYDIHQKLEAVERAIGLCKRAAPSMIAKGALTQGQLSNLLEALKQVGFDYQSQTLDAKATSTGCSSLNDSTRSGNSTFRRVD